MKSLKLLTVGLFLLGAGSAPVLAAVDLSRMSIGFENYNLGTVDNATQGGTNTPADNSWGSTDFSVVAVTGTGNSSTKALAMTNGTASKTAVKFLNPPGFVTGASDYNGVSSWSYDFSPTAGGFRYAAVVPSRDSRVGGGAIPNNYQEGSVAFGLNTINGVNGFTFRDQGAFNGTAYYAGALASDANHTVLIPTTGNWYRLAATVDENATPQVAGSRSGFGAVSFYLTDLTNGGTPQLLQLRNTAGSWYTSLPADLVSWNAASNVTAGAPTNSWNGWGAWEVSSNGTTQFDNFQVTVPEPTSLALLALGGLMLCPGRRKA